MTKPLALVCYENLLPGSQLVNRLQDLGYRVQTLVDTGQLVAEAFAAKPIVVITDLVFGDHDICAAISELKNNPATGHIPVLAFTDLEKNKKLAADAQTSGATLVSSDQLILEQLPQLLDQTLEV